MEYNPDNGLADELLKQTNASRIELLARNGILVFFLSLNAQELTRFPPSPSFCFCVSMERGIRQTNHRSTLIAFSVTFEIHCFHQYFLFCMRNKNWSIFSFTVWQTHFLNLFKNPSSYTNLRFYALRTSSNFKQRFKFQTKIQISFFIIRDFQTTIYCCKILTLVWREMHRVKRRIW